MTTPSASTAESLRYRAYGMTLDSCLPLPELDLPSHRPADATDIRLSLVDCHSLQPQPSNWFLSKRSASGGIWMTGAKVANGYLLRFPDLADFVVTRLGRDIVGVPCPGTDEATIRHLFLDQVLPLALTLHGHHALHATAVLTPAGVCAFIGEAGAGKSTLAASFQCAGYSVLGDDCLVLDVEQEVILARPAYPGVRLWDDSLQAVCRDPIRTGPVADYTSKRRALFGGPTERFPTDPHPLVRIYALARHPSSGRGTHNLAVERLSRPHAFMEILAGTFTLETQDRAFLQKQFEWIGQVTAHVPVRRLHMATSYSALASVRDAVLSDMTRS